MAAVGTVEFWDTFHARKDTEWYLPVDVVVREVLRVQAELIRLSPPAGEPIGDEARAYPRILHPGCGSSTLGVVLQREHGCHVVNADFSKGLVDSMSSRFPGCDFVVSNARRTGFPNGSFDLAVDKGLFDSVTAKTVGRLEAAKEFLGEAARVLSPGGKYMMFSAFSNDGLGHKDMEEMLAHSGFGGEVQIRELDTPPLEYPDQNSSYLYILTRVVDREGLRGGGCSESL